LASAVCSFAFGEYFLFGKEKKPLRWLVFPTENLFFGKTQITFLLGLLFFDVPFFVFNESCGKNCHTPNTCIGAITFCKIRFCNPLIIKKLLPPMRCYTLRSSYNV
jgi:hypothetical protein